MKDSFLSSEETKKKLKISSCKLMHLRQEGKIEFIKKGRGYYYKVKSL